MIPFEVLHRPFRRGFLEHVRLRFHSLVTAFLRIKPEVDTFSSNDLGSGNPNWRSVISPIFMAGVSSAEPMATQGGYIR